MPSLEENQANVALNNDNLPVQAAGYLAAWQADCLVGWMLVESLSNKYSTIHSTTTQQCTQQCIQQFEQCGEYDLRHAQDGPEQYKI